MRSILAFGLSLLAGLAAAQDVVVSRTVKGGFAEVRERVVLAVELQGLVVDHVSRVGEMLDRTGKDIGAGKQVYAQAEVLEFCSALVSRAMMEADAKLLTFCPFGIAVYSLPADPGTTHVAFRRPSVGASSPAKQALQRVESLLQAIVDEAAQ
jgi:uncharacterized protein (DUF302 family)